MSSRFKHIDLRIVPPPYESELTDIVMDLQHLRRHTLRGSTPPPIFFQLKDLFHMLESIDSARIEGNRTTIAEAVDARISPDMQESEGLKEIHNNEAAMRFIEAEIEEGTPITKALVRELHKTVVKDLKPPPKGEGDLTPGAFRVGNVSIKQSPHLPPDVSTLPGYLDELFTFINAPADPKLDLLRLATAHHRFAWIHPFTNGNGRVVRLATYAMLIARGFDVRTGRILNPSAIFCNDRNLYYTMLSKADSGSDDSLLEWNRYVLQGLVNEMNKIDKLIDYEFLKEKILRPAVEHCRSRSIISDIEARILGVAIEKVVFQASDIKKILPEKHAVQRSRVLRQMRENRLIEPIEEGARRYVIRFSKSLLTHGFVLALAKEGFIEMEGLGGDV